MGWPTDSAISPAGHHPGHWTSPPSRSCLDTGVREVTAQPRTANGMLPGSTVTHTKVNIDPNNGTRAGCLCVIPNPNRVKAKKGDRGWRMSLEPDHHRHRAGGKNRSVFGSEKKKKREQDPFGSENREGSRHSSRTLTQELNRSSSELGKESEREKERFRINPNPKKKRKIQRRAKEQGLESNPNPRSRFDSDELQREKPNRSNQKKEKK